MRPFNKSGLHLILLGTLLILTAKAQSHDETDDFTLGDRFFEIAEEGQPEHDKSPVVATAGSPSSSVSSACPVGFFACANGECISPKWRCDGHYDCDDFSDELNCTQVELAENSDVNLDDLVKKKPLPPPPPPQPKEELVEIKFNSSQEPLMLFSTGLSIRGYWMRTKVYFDVVTLMSQPVAKPDTISITQAFSMLFGKLGLDRVSASESETDSSLVRSRSTIVGIDMDPATKEVFWVELGKDAGVFSTVIDNDQFDTHHKRDQLGPMRKSIVDSGLLMPEDVALDNYGKNLYITDGGLPAIVVCSLRHSHCKMLVRDNIHKPRAIVVDSATGWLAYTDWGDHPGIFLVSMDGKKKETLVDTDVVWPNGLALDQASKQLYWADARLSKIERIDLVTRKRFEVHREASKNPFSLSVFENRVYWSDWSGSDIRTCDSMTGNSTKVIMRTSNIYGIHIYHPNTTKNPESNPCWSKFCSHMCLLGPTGATFAQRRSGALLASCACPESMTLSIGDRATCLENHLSFLLVNVKNYIAQVFPERIGLKTVEKVIYSGNHIIHDVASDSSSRLFFFDAVKQHIYSVEVVAKNVKIENFMPASQSVRGLLYDSYSKNLYWLDSDRGTLSICSIKAKFEKVLRSDLDRPISMVLDQKNRYLYISMLGANSHIIRTDIFAHNSSDVTIMGGDIGLPVALHLDEENQRLYWADARRESIESIDLDITSTTGTKHGTRVVHRRHLGTILAFAIYRNHFVWTIKNGDYLYKAPMVDALTAKIDEPRPISYKLPPNPSLRDPSSDNKRIILSDPKHEMFSSPCSKRGCSHGCVVDAKLQPVCFCPDGFKIHQNNKTNCIAHKNEPCEGVNMLKCKDNSHCILKNWKCDGTPDCDDASDEHDCHIKPTCPDGDFTCKNGHCISKSWVCDGSNDCGDNSDEANCPEKAKKKGCQEHFFDCGNGQCVPALWRCDREKDCENGNDEIDCLSDECKPNFFRCKDQQCVPHGWLCDQIKDCEGGEDEEHCPEVPCARNKQFMCDKNKCMDLALKCDGHKDCEDGYDEFNCTQPARVVTCGGDMFTCPGEEGHCLYPIDICDGHEDCNDGADESNCSHVAHKCKTYEVQCEPSHSTVGNMSNQHPKCIPRAWLCDGEDDCGDYSDEISDKCQPATSAIAGNSSFICKGDHYACESGECIPWPKVCDREAHCLDGSDEGGKCIVSCSINNGGCAQQCRPSPIGPMCACHEGYTLSNDTKTCLDIDECLIQNICEQQCHNFKGGYKCTCKQGYKIELDKRHCKLLPPETAELIIVDPSEIEAREAGSGLVWLIVIILLFSITGLITLVSVLILYRQGRLPRQVSHLSVSFTPYKHDKDGSMLLLDNEP